MKNNEMDIEAITKRLEQEGCRVLTEDELRLKVNGGWGRSSSSSSRGSSSSRSSSSDRSSSRSSGGGNSSKRNSGSTETTKTKTSFGQKVSNAISSIKSWAQENSSSNWQKNHPNFGVHSSSSSNVSNGFSSSISGSGSARTGGKDGYNGNGTKTGGKDGAEASTGSEEAKTSENTAVNRTAPTTAKASAPQPKSYSKGTFSYKNVGFVNQKTKSYTKFKTVVPAQSPVYEKSTRQKVLERNIHINSNNTGSNALKTQSPVTLSHSGIEIHANKNSVVTLKPNGDGSFSPYEKGSWNIKKTYPEGALFGVKITTPLGTGETHLDGFTVMFEGKF